MDFSDIMHDLYLVILYIFDVLQKQKKKRKLPSSVNFSALHLINDPQGKDLV